MPVSPSYQTAARGLLIPGFILHSLARGKCLHPTDKIQPHPSLLCLGPVRIKHLTEFSIRSIVSAQRNNSFERVKWGWRNRSAAKRVTALTEDPGWFPAPKFSSGGSDNLAWPPWVPVCIWGHTHTHMCVYGIYVYLYIYIYIYEGANIIHIKYINIKNKLKF